MEKFYTKPDPERPLEVCPGPNCGSHLVQPLDWAALDAGTYLWLRCPECEHRDEGLFTDEQVERYEEILEEGQLTFYKNWTELEEDVMQDEALEFVQGLQDGSIGPDDFRM
jgi:hypothetical protein